MNGMDDIRAKLYLLADLLPLNRTIPVVEFTGITTPHSSHPATKREVEDRIWDLHEKDGLLSLVGQRWNTLDDYVLGKEPQFTGEMGRKEVHEFGLYEPKPMVKIYQDGIYLPRTAVAT